MIDSLPDRPTAGATVIRRLLPADLAAIVAIENDTFTLREVKTAPDDPTNATVVLELNDTAQRATVAKDQPFRRVDGYVVDMKYAPEAKTWTNRRVGASLAFNGEDYNIVAITENEVVLSAKSNQKKWTIKYRAGAAP